MGWILLWFVSYGILGPTGYWGPSGPRVDTELGVRQFSSASNEPLTGRSAILVQLLTLS